MTGMWHTAVVSKLTHLQDSHKRFCFTLCLVRCAWLGFRGGPGAHKALGTVTAAAAGEAGQVAGLTGHCRRMED